MLLAKAYVVRCCLREKTEHLSQNRNMSVASQDSLQEQRDLIEAQMLGVQETGEKPKARVQNNDCGIFRQ